MATFIKAGFWEKLCKPCKGYKGWLNLDEFVQSLIPPAPPAPIAPYQVFTALLTQNGGNGLESISEGITTIGVSYTISNYVEGDFTIIGAPNNLVGTSFIATGIFPDWGLSTGSQLVFNSGAPVATVLENTIGNIWFTFLADGSYFINKQDNFDPSKTAIFIGPPTWDGGDYYFQAGPDGVGPIYLVSKYLPTGLNVNGAFQNTTIEIRIYS